MKDALVICRMALYIKVTFYITGRLNISISRIDLRFKYQAVWREAHVQDPYSCFKKSGAYY